MTLHYLIAAIFGAAVVAAVSILAATGHITGDQALTAITGITTLILGGGAVLAGGAAGAAAALSTPTPEPVVGNLGSPVTTPATGS